MFSRKVPRPIRTCQVFLAGRPSQHGFKTISALQGRGKGLSKYKLCHTPLAHERQWQPNSMQKIACTRFVATTHKKTFDKLLVANRGEIACRIIKTARSMGIQTVAIYSDLDAKALHVRLADEAVCIGDADAYLSIPRILQVVRQTGAQAVHPGYGFLSENPAFVQALEAANVAFVGPRASAISAMGDKIQSKLIAKASGVNCIPGFDGEIVSVEEARKVADDIGYPVMIKASAGGGGKGMRIAWNDVELAEGFVLAKQESQSAFGDGRMLIEKYIDKPRHIEIQVLGDNHGNVVYLPERECSIQRRNQKVIEESPSVHIDEATRKRMGEQAVALAKHVKYNSAGTVEFLVDSRRNFYFLEMNTRLQVEHPITEMVTGLDLVEQMVYSAAGYPLAITQTDVKRHGWAIESRIYAEDPSKYLPSTGRLTVYREPARLSPHVRCDSGIVEGSEIGMDYDPLLCKLATHGNTRAEAINAMVDALDNYVIKGVTHNIPLLRDVMTHPRFQSGDTVTTNFLAEEYPHGYQSRALAEPEFQQLAAVVASMWAKKEKSRWIDIDSSTTTTTTALAMPHSWDVWVHATDEQTEVATETKITLESASQDTFKVSSPLFGPLTLNMEWPLDDLLALATVRETSHPLVVQYLDVLDLGFRVQYRGNKYKVAILDDNQHNLKQYMKTRPKEVQGKFITSPMPGRIVRLAVQAADKITQGSEVAVIEAMKMRNVIRSSREGTVKGVYVQQGDAIKVGQNLIEFDDNDKTN